MQYAIPKHLVGLTSEELQISKNKYGLNTTSSISTNTWYQTLFEILKEPMLLLLFAVTIIYFIVGNYSEAIFMLGAIIAVSGISFYQDNRSKHALAALKKLNEPLSMVIRGGEVIEIPTTEIAVGDLYLIEEGKMINADGIIVHSNDFSVNEASLTGESFSVYKSKDADVNQVYSGTLVVSGLAVVKVEKIGAATQLGKIGQSIQAIGAEPTPLQLQITKFVKGMAYIGIVVFLLVWGFVFWKSGNFIESLLSGLTLAMSILPEEIPVAFTTFMALGAWKLMKEGVIIKKSSVVETLGSTTVICTDKTGTITENAMHLKLLYDYNTNQVYEAQQFNANELTELIQYAMWSSEPVPFDPMEITLHEVYSNTQLIDQRNDFQLIHEYPLEGKPPMMTHVWQDNTGQRIIAAKGAPEAILAVSKLSEDKKTSLRQYINDFGNQGYRVLGVAKSNYAGQQYPEQQQNITFDFLGFTVFNDPPKKDIQAVFKKIYAAGIKVKVITGDNAATTNAIAQQAGIENKAPALNGSEVVKYSEATLIDTAKKTTLFTRMFPEAKLTMVNALKKDGEVVAMLGDGVNDAPALKAAHIGVAMGNKGTEIAKGAAAVIITNDDLGKLIIGIEAGRRIYTNIKKAIQYIISIHIPIILTVTLPLFLGWVYPQIFTPIHVIFLELIMGPICSIVYENEPIEKNAMLVKPRKLTDTFLNWGELSMSIIQGLIITSGILFIYQYAVSNGGDEYTTRSMVFSTLVFANIFLSLVNRSFVYSVLDSLKNKNRLFPAFLGTTLLLLFVIIYMPPVAAFFKVKSMPIQELAMSIGVAAVSVFWFEVYKWLNRKQRLTTQIK